MFVPLALSLDDKDIEEGAVKAMPQMALPEQEEKQAMPQLSLPTGTDK